MNNSIFNNNTLKHLLSQYNPNQILYIPIDVAKYYHSAMIINFFGDIIIPKFDFPYNNHGLDFLVNKLHIAQQKTQAVKFFFGLESTGHYHENLVLRL